MLELGRLALGTSRILVLFAAAAAPVSCALIAGIETFDRPADGATSGGSTVVADASSPSVGDSSPGDTATGDDGSLDAPPTESSVPESAAAIRPSDLVGYFPLDEKGGTNVSDKSANGNDGTLLGSGTWTAGHVNGALKFNGGDTCIDLGAPAVLRVATPFTIALWTKVESFGSGTSTAYLLSQTLDPYNAGWRFGSQAPNVYSFKIAVPSSEPDPELVSGPQPGNTWTHVAVVLESPRASLYVNGALAGLLVNPAPISYDNATLRIGCREGLHYFAGVIDEVRLYRAALTAAEVGVLAK